MACSQTNELWARDMGAEGYKPLSKYGLTRFFLLSVVSTLANTDEVASAYVKNPKKLFAEGKAETLCDAIENILRAVIVDLNYEVKELGESFDYKGDLKSPNKIRELRNRLLRSYEKDVARKKEAALGELLS